MHTLLAIALLGYHPFEPVTVETRVDLIELNHFFTGETVGHQYIFWDFMPETLDTPQDGPSNGYRVVAWRWVRQIGKHPTTHGNGVQLLWTEETGIRRVWAPKWIESWTMTDIEVADRRVLPMADRRGLSPPSWPHLQSPF